MHGTTNGMRFDEIFIISQEPHEYKTQKLIYTEMCIDYTQKGQQIDYKTSQIYIISIDMSLAKTVIHDCKEAN